MLHAGRARNNALWEEVSTCWLSTGSKGVRVFIHQICHWCIKTLMLPLVYKYPHSLGPCSPMGLGSSCPQWLLLDNNLLLAFSPSLPQYPTPHCVLNLCKSVLCLYVKKSWCLDSDNYRVFLFFSDMKVRWDIWKLYKAWGDSSLCRATCRKLCLKSSRHVFFACVFLIPSSPTLLAAM